MRRVLPLMTAPLLIAAVAAAQPAQRQDPCAGDVKRLCAEVQTGAGGVLRCLRRHGSELSSDCKQAIAAMAHLGGMGRQAGSETDACRADMQKYCAGIEPGQGRIRACLREHINQVAEECKIVLMASAPPPTAATPAAPAPTAAPTP